MIIYIAWKRQRPNKVHDFMVVTTIVKPVCGISLVSTLGVIHLRIIHLPACLSVCLSACLSIHLDFSLFLSPYGSVVLYHQNTKVLRSLASR